MQSQLSSWFSGLVIPAFFTVLGAVVSLLVTEWRERRQAKRQKNAFMRAVGMELDALAEQLSASLPPIEDSLERLKYYGIPHLLVVIRNTVFTSQLGKLRDVDDPLLIELIKLYSDLGTIDRLLDAVHEHGKAYQEILGSGSQLAMDAARNRTRSALLVLKENTLGFLTRIRGVRAKLPAAPMS